MFHDVTSVTYVAANYDIVDSDCDGVQWFKNVNKLSTSVYFAF
jgi:hypothetical protein